MSRNPEVVIIGGGIIGCSIAYYLSHSGIDVLVCEREALGSQASGVAAGLLIPFTEHPHDDQFLSMGLKSLETHRFLSQSLSDETGIDVHFEQTPVVIPAFSDLEVEQLKRNVEIAKNLGLKVHWENSYHARQYEPALGQECMGALISTAEAQVQPYSLVLALAQASENLGTEFRYSEVISVKHRPGENIEVITENNSIITETVIFAMGPWTSAGGSWIDFPIKVTPQKGQLLHFNSRGIPLKSIIFHNGSYLTPKPEHIIIAGATEESTGFNVSPTPQSTTTIIETAIKLAPSMADAGMIKALAGLRPISPDGLPLLGQIPHCERIFVATGHGRNGVLLGPITGQILKDCVMGESLSGSWESFLIDRFRKSPL